MKCPACRKGFVFTNKSVFPLSKCLDLVDYCNVCSHSMQYNTNNGGGINYALTMALFFLNIFWYAPIFGLSYKDNSFVYFIVTSAIVVLLAQPWLMRFSRLLFLYFLVKFNIDSLFESDNNISDVQWKFKAGFYLREIERYFMNNFNRVFWAVQKHCKERGSVSGDVQFQKIAEDLGISGERLHYFLDCIAETGVIKYLPENKTVLLTEKGRNALRVFP